MEDGREKKKKKKTAPGTHIYHLVYIEGPVMLPPSRGSDLSQQRGGPCRKLALLLFQRSGDDLSGESFMLEVTNH